ncbi:unnamed protein product [Cylicocyclus nassatus]|uniref:Uncharacterized protein n=1 Tax=Cylicocyclus nassatus TaxID=53992 RepID=A0AA36GEI1_CYLNA|nr:unnamed protein product [Cylicocyclus nassatus]
MSQATVIVTIIVFCVVDARYRRQIESGESYSDMVIHGWDPTIRDRFESCHSMASFAPTEQYCEAFTTCCSMQFDPNNGDKCQTNEQRCIPLQQGGADAVCIHLLKVLRYSWLRPCCHGGHCSSTDSTTCPTYTTLLCEP